MEKARYKFLIIIIIIIIIIIKIFLCHFGSIHCRRIVNMSY